MAEFLSMIKYDHFGLRRSVKNFINDLFVYFRLEFVRHFGICLDFLKTIRGKILLILLAILVRINGSSLKHTRHKENYLQILDLRCENFKCENGGIRMFSNNTEVSCWCTPDYVGEHCQTIVGKPVSFMSRIIPLFGHKNLDVSRGRPKIWWSIFPFTSGLQLETVYDFHQSAVKRLVEVSSAAKNDGYAARILPRAWPTIWTKSKYFENLPQLDALYNGIFKQKLGRFIPDQNNRNILHNAFYQYFVLQFLDANSNLTVTASQLYGSDPISERSMRSFHGGKLKTMKMNYEHYVLNQKFTRYNVRYFKYTIKEIIRKITWKFKRAEMFSRSQLLSEISKLWIREHNRVCDELSRKSPSWPDEELYTTARNVVTGQMMTIMMKEILNVELKPEVNRHRMENISGSGTPIELYLTMAVSSLPEILQYRQVSEDGLKDALKFMVNSKMDMFTAHKDGALTEYLTRTLMALSREHFLQGFNNYRRLLGLPAYNSFFDLTGNIETATELKNLYSTVEDVELLTGVLTERSSLGVLPTAKVLSNSFIITAILTNNITAKHSWVPDTFGGVEFFDLVKSTSLESLVYRNVDVNRD